MGRCACVVVCVVSEIMAVRETAELVSGAEKSNGVYGATRNTP
jgi:hypothetical protein